MRALRRVRSVSEDLDLGSGGIEWIDPVVAAPAEPLTKRQPVGRSRLRNPVPGQEGERVAFRSASSVHLVGADKDGVRGDGHRRS
jgi:hypothetical protein